MLGGTEEIYQESGMSKDTKGKAMGNLGSTRSGGMRQEPHPLMGRIGELLSQVPLKHLGTVTACQIM